MELTVTNRSQAYPEQRVYKTNRSQAYPEQRVYKKGRKIEKFDCGFEGMQL